MKKMSKITKMTKIFEMTKMKAMTAMPLKTVPSSIVAHPSPQTGGRLPVPHHQDPKEASGGQVRRMGVLVMGMVLVMVMMILVVMMTVIGHLRVHPMPTSCF